MLEIQVIFPKIGMEVIVQRIKMTPETYSLSINSMNSFVSFAFIDLITGLVLSNSFS